MKLINQITEIIEESPYKSWSGLSRFLGRKSPSQYKKTVKGWIKKFNDFLIEFGYELSIKKIDKPT